jgi:hypothetical protein
MAILRSIALFLVGVGATAGVYMSGLAEKLPGYLSDMGGTFHSSDAGYSEGATVPVGDDGYVSDDGSQPVMLELSANEDARGCPVRYLVRNNSGRTVELGINGYRGEPVRVAPGKALYPDDGADGAPPDRCPLVRINVQEP